MPHSRIILKELVESIQNELTGLDKAIDDAETEYLTTPDVNRSEAVHAWLHSVQLGLPAAKDVVANIAKARP